MSAYTKAIQDLEERQLAHRLAAESYKNEDMGIKTASSVLTAVVSALSYWEIFSTIPYVGWVLAGMSTITAVLASVHSARGSAQLGSAHFEVSQKLELVKTYCLAEALESDLTQPQITAIVAKSLKEIQDTLKTAPLLPQRFELAAKTRLKNLTMTV